jgi:hypothetical protein
MIYQTLGALAKEETLKTVEHNVLPNSFVLESEEPYPGYHGANLPTGTRPEAIFLMIREKLSTEKIIRISQNIKTKTNLVFDAAPGKICIYNETYYCIRIRSIDSYEIIPDIQSNYVKKGIDFMKKKKVHAPGLIQLKKSFYLEELNEDVLQDLDDERMYYLRIGRQVSWEKFKHITQKIKNNIDNNNFDAALAAIYAKEVIDLIRIYAKDLDTDRLNFLEEKYREELSKLK